MQFRRKILSTVYHFQILNVTSSPQSSWKSQHRCCVTTCSHFPYSFPADRIAHHRINCVNMQFFNLAFIIFDCREGNKLGSYRKFQEVIPAERLLKSDNRETMETELMHSTLSSYLRNKKAYQLRLENSSENLSCIHSLSYNHHHSSKLFGRLSTSSINGGHRQE